MYIRQIAYFHATPKDAKHNRLTQFRQDYPETTPLPLPPLECGRYLIDLLGEAGTTMTTGMGTIPLSYQEISAWLQLSQRDLLWWEIQTIKEMSRAYTAELNNSTDADSEMPYNAAPEMSRDQIEQKAINILSSFKKRKG